MKNETKNKKEQLIEVVKANVDSEEVLNLFDFEEIKSLDDLVDQLDCAFNKLEVDKEDLESYKEAFDCEGGYDRWEELQEEYWELERYKDDFEDEGGQDALDDLVVFKEELDNLKMDLDELKQEEIKALEAKLEALKA